MKEHRALDQILEPGGIRPVYQPVYEVAPEGCSLVGFECLSRGPLGSNFESAQVLFEYVRLKREESLVDRACVHAALKGSRALPDHTQLGVNVHASTLGRDQGFLEFLRTTALDAEIPFSRLTVEIVEHSPPWDGVSFLNALDELRELEIQIALDDVGLGQSNFKMILDVCPDFLKLDRYFVDGCAKDPKREAVIELVAQLGERFGARLIAEGVEDVETVSVLATYGVRLIQGFLFSEPLEASDAVNLNRMQPVPGPAMGPIPCLALGPSFKARSASGHV